MLQNICSITVGQYSTHSSGHRQYPCSQVGSEKFLHFSGILHTAGITCWKQHEVMWYIFKMKPCFYHTTHI